MYVYINNIEKLSEKKLDVNYRSAVAFKRRFFL